MNVKARILHHINWWRPVMGLDGWRMAVRWDEAKHIATCQAQSQYEDFVLTFNLPAIRRDMKGVKRAEADAWLEELVVHELTHAATWKSSERTVTRLSRALLRAKYGPR